jgi:hypothetical protein
MNANELNDGIIVQLAKITEIYRELKTPLPVLLNWLVDRISTIRMDTQLSLYEQVFLNPTVHKPELVIFELIQTGSELADTSQLITDHVPIMYSALGISAAELVLLTETDLPNTTLNLSNLTRLYQIISLSKRLRLSISEYGSLRGLSGIDPFGAGAVDRLKQFVDIARKVKSVRFSIAQFDYLLRHVETDSEPVGPATNEVTAVLATLRAGLYQITLEHTLPESDDGILQMVGNMLAKVMPADVSGHILAIINRTSDRSQEDQIAFIKEHLTFFLDTNEVIDAWLEEVESENSAPAERARIVLEPLLLYLRRLEGENLIIQTMASAHVMELASAEMLLRNFVLVPDSNEPILSIFLADGFVPPISEMGPPLDFQGATSVDLFPDQYASYYRLAKVVLVLKILKVPVGGVEFFFTSGIASGWPDLNLLPLEPIEHSEVELIGFLNIAKTFQIAEELFGNVTILFDLLLLLKNEDIERQDFLASVASRSGWSIQDLIFLTDSSALDLEFPQGFLDGGFLVQLCFRFDLLRKLGISAEAVHQWTTQPVTAETARAVKQAARAGYEDKTQWLMVAKPLRDELREQQRKALVAFLVHQIELDNSNDLYAHFLVDVEMNPCMLTSRIVLATNSVQLFIQRCLLNLEEIELSVKDAEEWAWMKNYRIWEATRKIFLYPENWILPELRDDKTQFFRQLESGLLQDEINEASVRREYLAYLNKLSQVAQLKICGLYRQWEVNKDILHVFGRTRNTPHVYYYRRWVDRRYWTPWEPIDINIEGNHLVPVVWNGHLYLFWPMFQEQGDRESFDDQEQKELSRYYDVRIAYSEYRNRIWHAPRISEAYIETKPTDVLPPKDRFSFWAYQNTKDELLIGFLAIDKVEGFSGATPGDAILSDLFSPHFKLSVNNGEMEVQEYPEILVSMPEVPPKMTLHFNSFRKKEKTGLELVTSGRTLETFLVFRYLDLVTKKTTKVLGTTPSGFHLMIPHATRPFISQSPLFYQDNTRTFLIQPIGTYLGGVDTVDDLTLKLNVVPLDLPDIVTHRIAGFLSQAPVQNGTTGRIDYWWGSFPSPIAFSIR